MVIILSLTSQFSVFFSSNRAERLNLENVPNNVAKVAEGKLPQPQQSPELNKYPRKKRRRRKSKHKVKISQKQSKTPEQESCPPIPVQVGSKFHLKQIRICHFMLTPNFLPFLFLTLITVII